MKSKFFGFKECCEQKTKFLTKLMREDYKFFTFCLDKMCMVYHTLYSKEANVQRIENSSVISLWIEMIDTIDAICVLHCNQAISPANILVRKLMELETQFKYMLMSDYENKALAYEAYYVSRAAKGGDMPENVYLGFDRYKEYKRGCEESD